jgi:hypothetical protein
MKWGVCLCECVCVCWCACVCVCVCARASVWRTQLVDRDVAPIHQVVLHIKQHHLARLHHLPEPILGPTRSEPCDP